MALTGLRRCDARNKNNKLLGGDLLHYTDSKTGGEHKIKLSKEALKLFEETDFSAFDESNAIGVKIHHEWIGNAGWSPSKEFKPPVKFFLLIVAKDLCEKHQLTLVKEIGRKLNVLDSDGLEHLILRNQLAIGHSKIGIS